MDKAILNMISAFMEVGLVVIFLFYVFILIRSAIKGYKQGIYKSTYYLVGYALLFVLALITIKPLTRMVYTLPLEGFFKQNPYPVDISFAEKHVQFDLTIGTVESTLTDFITGICNQINASESLSVSVSQFAKTLTASIISFTVYSIDLELIVTFGTLFLWIMWKLCFEKLTPKIAQRVGKIKFVGMAENLVTRLLLFYLTLAPFTSLINAVNQGIQNSKAKDSQNQYVQDIVNLVDIYNDSLFAQTFFNWQTGLSGSNITFDQAIMDHFTKTLSSTGDAYTLAEEIGNLTNAFGNVAACLGEGADGKPIITEFSEDLVNPVFDLLGNSPFINDLFQISVELALNTDFLVDVVPNYQYFDKVDISDVSLSEEIEVLRGMANDIFETHILDEFISVENGEMQFNSPGNLVEYLDNLFTLPENREKVNKLFNVFNRVDDLKLLNACYKSLGYWAVTLDSEQKVLKFLGGDTEIDNPYDDPNNKQIVVDFINDFDIGHEMYTIFDSCWGLAACGDHVIINAYNSFRSKAEGESDEEFKNIQQNAKNALATTLRDAETTSNFRDAICGVNHMNEDGSSKERDSTKGEHYALMDSKILAKFINETPFMRNFLDNMDLQEKYGSGYEEATSRWNVLMDDVYDDDPSKPLPIKFFKNEVNHILTVITDVIQLEVPTSSSIAPAPYRAMLKDEIEEQNSEEKEPFEYKDYPSFLDAVVNLFDGWINPDDIFGSAFDLDSRIAPYLSKAFKCLEELDKSQIVYALGIPFIDEQLAAQKEKTQEFFDVDIIIYQLNHSNDVFAQLANFMNDELISALQHFYKGFMMNDEGQFAFDTLTNSVKDDIDAFLDKFNSYLEIKPDNPDTAAYDPVLDEHPLKYYFASILKKFYNFELFNPHSGVYKNKNMQNMFDFIFLNMEEQGVERPSSEVYAQLDPAGKWEEELDAISNLFGVLGENNMLKFADYSSSISSTLLYSLAGDISTASSKGDYDPRMPKNLGDVLSAVGDSVLFSNLMGGLLDTNLNNSLCDTTIGVTYKNINSKEYWHEEGENMSELLLSIAKLDLDLQNLDLTKVTDVVGMNDMLHKLSDSLIFKSEDGNKFGEWLHKKVDAAMASMSEGLLNDPEATYWDSDWDEVIDTVDNENYPNQKIAHYDFLVRDGVMPSNYEDNKAAWNISDYDALMTSFKNEYNYDSLSKVEADELYKQDGFIEDYYEKVLKYDEIGRVVNVIATGIKIMDGGDSIDFDNITADNLDNFLTATNNTNCLRIASYNAMKLSKENVGTNDFTDISKAHFEYLIAADASIDNYVLGRANRQEEIDHIVEFYSNYKEIQRIAGNDLSADSFFNKVTLMDILGVDENGDTDPNKKDYFTGLLAGLQATHCFNLSVVEDRTLDDVSFFENMMINMMNNSGLTELADSTPSEIEARVKKLSNHDFYNTINDEGYNSVWTERDGANEVIGGENACFVDVFKKVINATSGDAIDANNIAVTDLPASEVTDIMKAVNGSYLCTGVMNHFIKDAFTGEMGLEELLKYEPTDTEMIADFDLDYLDYGGSNNNCGEGTEIYCIYKAIESMQYEDSVTHEYKFVDLDDFQASLNSNPDCLDGVFYFLFNSKTLAKTEIRDSVEVKGRSVMLYNALDNFDSYLIGNNKANKINAIEKLFTTSTEANGDKAYLIEANGLTRLTDEAGNSIVNVTLDTLRANATKRNMILNVVKYTYDRNDGNVRLDGSEFSTDPEVRSARSYFTSEIVSGIFDDVLNTEYGTIDSIYSNSRIATFADHEKFYFASNSTGGRATSSNDITTSTFNNLNEVERRGLQGAIELTRYFNGEADRTGTDVSNIESNFFIVDILNNKDTIREVFTDYFYNDTENKDSRFAKILFISRGALSIEKETATANDTYPEDSGLFVILKYTHQLLVDTSTNPSDCVWFAADGYREDYYGSSFNFRDYGNDLMDYIESCEA